MPIAACIITVCCWVEPGLEQVTAGVKRRTRGFAPHLSDSAVITMAIVGEFLGYEGDAAIGEYCKWHWAAWFPGLGDRRTLVRQAANLWRVKPLLHDRLVAELGARTADCPISDGFPISVCQLARASGSQVLKAEADYGYCAAKDECYYGWQAHLLIDLRGVVVGITVTAANVDERASADDLLSAIEGLLLGDQGCIRPQCKADCEALGIDLQTPVRQNMPARRPRWWLQRLRRLRKRVETVLSQLEQRLGLAKTRARAGWHVTNPVTRKLLAHTVGVWLNLHQGRAPLDRDGLVTA